MLTNSGQVQVAYTGMRRDALISAFLLPQCHCHWQHECGSASRRTSLCMPCLSGTEYAGDFQFKARPAYPHDQEQESSLSERGQWKNQSNHKAWRCRRRRHGRNGALSSPAAPTTRYLILLHWDIDDIYQVYTRYIPVIYQHQSIYLVYTKYIWSISLVYTIYIADIGIYLVYTWYISPICQHRRHSRYIPHKNFDTLVRYQSRTPLDWSYTWYIPVISRYMTSWGGYVTGTEQVHRSFCVVYTCYVADVDI